jgi:hypothetical protein
MVTDEELSRYIDGELADDEMTSVCAAIAADPGLGARLERLRAADRFFVGAIGSVNEQPLPKNAATLLNATSPTRALDVAPRHVATRFSSWRMPMALAASFAIGTLCSVAILSGIGRQSQSLAAGPLVPHSRLAEALGSAASGAEVRIGQAVMTPVLSFRAADGRFCREFRWENGAAGAHGVACRRDGSWTVQVAAAEPGARGYRPAASSAAVDAFVEEMMAGEPLSAEDERGFLVKARVP